MNKIFIALTTLLIASTAQAEDATPHGESLHNANCVSCHANMTGGQGTTLYTRSDRKVSSLPKLEAQVRRCESNLGLQWFDEDILAVKDYLNHEFYKF